VTSRPSAARVPAAPAAGQIRPAFIGQGAVIGASLAIYALVVIQAGGRQQDFGAYLAAGHDLLSGHPLYATFLQHPFPDPTLRPAYIYPPIFALLIAPLALVPAWLATAAWVLINQAALALSLLLFIRRYRPGGWATAGLIAATLSFYPLWIDAAQGQANLLVLVLVVGGLIGVLSGQPRAGVLIGIAAGLKLTPALLILWLLVERRLKDASWMAAGFLAVTGLGALVRWDDSLTFFTRVAPALARGTAVYANQSVSGLLARLTTANPYTHPWVVLPLSLLLPVLAALLAGYWLWSTHDRDLTVRAGAFFPLLPLLSSVTWPHHLVILLPVIWFAIIAIASLGWPVVRTLALITVLLGFSVLARWPAGPAFGQTGFMTAQTGDPLVLLTANAMFLSTLALFLLAPWLLRSR
jgi:alpha-1,2-mannosyltransferase